MIWIKLKIFAPYDKIANSGTKYRTTDGKRTLVNPNGREGFSIRKGRCLPIDFEWENLKEAKEIFDENVFDFFKNEDQAVKACKKEEKLLKMLPIQKMEAKQKRVREKVLNSKYGQNRPTIDQFLEEAKKVGVDVPKNLN